MKTYGSAVLTALHAQYKNIEEIERLATRRRIKVFLEGRDCKEWLDEFWKQIAIITANGVSCELSIH